MSTARSSPRRRSSRSAIAAVAVTGVSASLAEGELEEAAALAQLIGIRHERLDTDELANPAYAANAPDRCFHCKTELYTQLAALAERLGVAVIASGTNVDDLGDYRPGLAAAADHGVRQPAGRVRHHQSRRPGAGGRLGSARRRQAGVAVPFEPRRLRPGRHARAAANDRPRRANRPLARHRASAASAILPATSPAIEVPTDSIADAHGTDRRTHGSPMNSVDWASSRCTVDPAVFARAVSTRRSPCIKSICRHPSCAMWLSPRDATYVLNMVEVRIPTDNL